MRESGGREGENAAQMSVDAARMRVAALSFSCSILSFLFLSRLLGQFWLPCRHCFVVAPVVAFYDWPLPVRNTIGPLVQTYERSNHHSLHWPLLPLRSHSLRSALLHPREHDERRDSPRPNPLAERRKEERKKGKTDQSKVSGCGRTEHTCMRLDTLCH